MDEDRELFRFDFPDFLPEFGFIITKAHLRKRLCVLFWWHDRRLKVFKVDGEHNITHSHWLQLRLWWPPIMYVAGWTDWNG